MPENEDYLERAREVCCHTKQLILEAEWLHTQSRRLVANAKMLRAAVMQEETQNGKQSSSTPRPQSVPE